MHAIRFLWRIFIDAVYPLSEIEKRIIDIIPSDAYFQLPKSPPIPGDKLKAIFAYKDELVQNIIWNIKSKHDIHSVNICAHASRSELALISARSKLEIILLIPIPITKKRRRERGYNQCELILNRTSELLQETGHKAQNSPIKFMVINNLLIRTVHKKRQALKKRQDRIVDAKGVFALNESAILSIQDNYKTMCLNNDFSKEKFYSSKIIVFDDVITTGSTINEAMDVLENAGFKNVEGLAMAH